MPKPAPSPEIPIPENLEDRYREAAAALLQNHPLRGWPRSSQGRSPALSAGEVEALRSVGLPPKPWKRGAGRDPLTRTVIDYVALVESSLTARETAELLGVNTSRIRQRIEAGSLFGIREGNQWRLPRFQFERGRTLPGLAEVLAAQPREINPLDLAEWFLAPNADLEVETSKKQAATLSPRAWLLNGLPPADVARMLKNI